jgi:hypothetical protein
MKIETSIGEIVDKLTILEIKKSKINDPDKLKNINLEYSYLYPIVFSDPINIDQEDYSELFQINSKLWEIEDDIRKFEDLNDFGEAFIELARSVYKTNDLRALVKRRINEKHNSLFKEEKSYK